MPRLEDLEITKVAFVPQGDNKRAWVMMFKKKPESKAPESVSEPSVPTEPEQSVLKRMFMMMAHALGIDKPCTEEASSDSSDSTVTKHDETDKTIPETKGSDHMEVLNIDKSKLTPEEATQLEALVSKAGAGCTTSEDTDTHDTGSETSAMAKETSESAGAKQTTTDEGDIYKGLHPAVAAELRELRRRADAAEDRELNEVAKKYALIGKDTAELVKSLKEVKAAGGTAYDEMISVLDASLAIAEKSGAFSEVGKSGSGQPDAWALIEKHADEIMKTAPNMTRTQAIDKACEQHPELVAEYEAQRNGSGN